MSASELERTKFSHNERRNATTSFCLWYNERNKKKEVFYEHI